MPSWLSVGAGASQGLEDYLKSALEEELTRQKLGQTDTAQAETMRHNIAGEENARQTADTMAQYRKDNLSSLMQTRGAAADKTNAQTDAIYNPQPKEFAPKVLQGKNGVFNRIDFSQNRALPISTPQSDGPDKEFEGRLPPPPAPHYGVDQDNNQTQTDREGNTVLSPAPGGKQGDGSTLKMRSPVPQTFVANTVDEKGNPIQKVMPKTVGTSTPSAPTGAQRDKADSASKAQVTLGSLDKSIDDAASMLGPAMGRMSDLEQRIGDADPKIQRVAALMMAAKLQTDAAVGGMRGAASPQLLARWDTLMANNVTPEGLHAVVQVMREMATSPHQATGAAPSAAAPDPYQEYLNRNKGPKQ